MRKLFSLIAAVLFAGSMMAAEATLQYTGSTTTNMAGDGANNAEIVGLDANVFTVICDKGANQNNIGLNKAGDIRLYADKDGGNGNKLIVNIVSGKILSIVLDIKQEATFVVKAGEDVVEAVEGAYAINAASFSIQNTTTNATTQLQLNKITINYEAGEAPAVAKPVIEGKEYFIGSTTVTMSCSTEDADIYYTVDGTTDPKCDCSAAPEYKNPITLTETTTIMAAAWTGNDWSAVATKTFTKVEEATCAQAAALAADEITGLNEVVVTYVNGGNIFIKDESGSLLIFANGFDLKAGDVVKGFIGKSSPYKGLPELVPAPGFTKEDINVEAGEAPEPEELTAAPTAADVNKYVVLKGVSFKAAQFDNKNITAVLGEEEFAVYNKFNADAAFDTEKKYDLVGVGSIYNTTLQLYFISAEEAETPIVENDTTWITFTDGYVDGEYFADYGSMDLYLWNIPEEDNELVGDGDYLVLDFYAESDKDIAGTYSIEDETLDAEYTYLLRINGADTAEVVFASGELVIIVNELDLEAQIANISFQAVLTTADEKPEVFVFEQTMTVWYFIEEEEGVEDIEEATKRAIKAIKNGQIIIEKNGVKYNALGTRL